jgi:hypothetical protein
MIHVSLHTSFWVQYLACSLCASLILDARFDNRILSPTMGLGVLRGTQTFAKSVPTVFLRSILIHTNLGVAHILKEGADTIS